MYSVMGNSASKVADIKVTDDKVNVEIELFSMDTDGRLTGPASTITFDRPHIIGLITVLQSTLNELAKGENAAYGALLKR